MKVEVTLNLDEEVERKVEIYALSEGISFDEAMEELIRTLLYDEIVEKITSSSHS
ncbi:hypothetical protein [Sulfolobus acidocaldarius]|uniref:Uncharacterized protein n=2 Tax=Sulfolobus acidocaldarius TaxID=2285 RepID=M1J1W8_9CREN|nr:hypothetical protein [Sulfolobus acidocaldarius]AGE70985.1 hypothetical protein SacN8_05070 [Sulfolobus acidocaldarius N8]AGE73256.1 hypothetical protein SacRon12I_05060 [Sulfolobus acidocaldarius Ron12/I]